MKLKLLLLVLMGLCIAFFPTILYAGTEPSPFQPEINQLGAVENGLNSCFDRVKKVLAIPPDPHLPSPDVDGAVNRLVAIDGQIGSLDDFVANTIYAVMGFEPTPFKLDLIPALEAVGNVSEAIVIAIDAVPPEPCVPSEPGVPPDPCYEFNLALQNVSASAMDLTDTVEWSIERLSEEMVTGDFMVFKNDLWLHRFSFIAQEMGDEPIGTGLMTHQRLNSIDYSVEREEHIQIVYVFVENNEAWFTGPIVYDSIDLNPTRWFVVYVQDNDQLSGGSDLVWFTRVADENEALNLLGSYSWGNYPPDDLLSGDIKVYYKP